MYELQQSLKHLDEAHLQLFIISYTSPIAAACDESVSVIHKSWEDMRLLSL